MNVLLEYCFDHDSARSIYGDIGDFLIRRGVSVRLVQCAEPADLARCDVLMSRDFVDREDVSRAKIHAIGGRRMTRPQHLQLIAECGVPVMPWALAANEREITALFERWEAARLLVKRSGTCKGVGITAFDRDHIGALSWDREHDVFCPELNETDGDVYKIELFNGRIIIGWVSRSPPLKASFDGVRRDIKGLYGDRRLISYSPTLARAARTLSRTLTSLNVGYASLDLMRSKTGELAAIEVNTGQVATWWTAQFPQMRRRYAKAAWELIKGTSARPRQLGVKILGSRHTGAREGSQNFIE